MPPITRACFMRFSGYLHTNKRVKDAALKLMEVVYSQKGAEMLADLAPEVKADSIKRLTKRLDKIEVVGMGEAKRMCEAGGEAEVKEEEPEYVDISGQLSPKLLSNLACTQNM